MKEKRSGQQFLFDDNESDRPANALSAKALERLSKKGFSEQVSYDLPFGKDVHSETAIFTASELMEKANEEGFRNFFGFPFADTTEFLYATECDLAGIIAGNESLEDIQEFVGDCTRCKLCEYRNEIVNSEGKQAARIMFIGEAPGKDEDESGHPFVGRAGMLLTKIIGAMELKRDDVFLGNVVRCRPPENRRPTPREIETCKQFMIHEISVVRPDVIVTLGITATEALLGLGAPLRRLRGRFFDFQGIPVMPTYHPAMLLHKPSLKSELWSDMQRVRAFLTGKTD